MLLRVVCAATWLVLSSATSLNGIYALLDRRLPDHAHEFSFSLVSGDADSYVVADKQSGIHVECTSVSGCARGLYAYLTERCQVEIWWTGSRLHELPADLPAVGRPITGQSIVPFRYHFNTVTFSYTTAFWDFEDWELELDWLALRGVNLPLAWVGYEYLLVETFHDVGLTDADIATFLSGPAYQAWNRFGNIQGSWGGTLPSAWLADQFALQKRIVRRIVELGMTPVLPAFTGFVPRALAELYPNASIIVGDQWVDFQPQYTNVSFLEPFDPLFDQMQTAFLTKQRVAYGNVSHVYTLDQYNEINPFNGDPTYLANISASTLAGLRAVDPDAVWMLQGWLFFASMAFWTEERIAAYLGGVADPMAMIVLDLYAEAEPQWNRTRSFEGKPWIWCMLHGFGGTINLEGNLPLLTSAPLAALAADGSSMAGLGLTMEGQEGNELVYDALLDQAWARAPLPLPAYVAAWTARRYRPALAPREELPQAAHDAWQLLARTVYSNTDTGVPAVQKSVYELTPALAGLVNLTGVFPTRIPYDTNATVVPALAALLSAARAAPALRESPEFAHDVVDLARQLLANRFQDAYLALVAAYPAEPAALHAAAAPMLAILDELDAVLGTDPHFLLSKWIASARRWAGEGQEDYARFLEYDARTQVTLWNPAGGILSDYASKAWAGLVGGYHRERWAMFVDYLVETVESGVEYDQTAFTARVVRFGQGWVNETWGERPRGVQGDVWDIVEDIMKRWT
ncbi:alpha-N-acetylglucosaminidase [Epithele typhae]|uniref:alpha-N-acetylglucosaminidase n=1 Tax=Epithele typhae TaxID=378194 RepID=UPI002008B0DD|nr:alpha-N-acetylglucosaminidase [Epithele typhae]KAH9933572.1 alpha-N-acetylglucosaminidase [Epithele typhae]